MQDNNFDAIMSKTEDEYLKSTLNKFCKSVRDLADKLPQWNSTDKKRRIQSAVSSLFEEAGEISGLISKYRTRKHYYLADPKSLDNFEEIKNKFMDEVGDFLWVLTCTAHCVVEDDSVIVNELAYFNKENEEYSLDFEVALFDVIRDIVLFEQYMLFDVQETVLKLVFRDIVKSFELFLVHLYKGYGISLADICEHNMKKLSNRYDDKGNRTDDK